VLSNANPADSSEDNVTSPSCFLWQLLSREERRRISSLAYGLGPGRWHKGRSPAADALAGRL